MNLPPPPLCFVFPFSLIYCWGVLDLLNFVLTHGRLDWFSHSITMQTFTLARYKTSKILWIEHTPAKLHEKNRSKWQILKSMESLRLCTSYTPTLRNVFSCGVLGTYSIFWSVPSVWRVLIPSASHQNTLKQIECKFTRVLAFGCIVSPYRKRSQLHKQFYNGCQWDFFKKVQSEFSV